MKVEKMPGVPKELLNGFSWAGTSGLAYLGPSPDTPEDTKPGGVMIMDKEPDPVILNLYDIKDTDAMGQVNAERSLQR